MKWLKWLPTFVNGLLSLSIIMLRFILFVFEGKLSVKWHYSASHFMGFSVVVMAISGISSLLLIRKHKIAAISAILIAAVGILLIFLWADSFSPY